METDGKEAIRVRSKGDGGFERDANVQWETRRTTTRRTRCDVDARTDESVEEDARARMRAWQMRIRSDERADGTDRKNGEPWEGWDEANHECSFFRIRGERKQKKRTVRPRRHATCRRCTHRCVRRWIGSSFTSASSARPRTVRISVHDDNSFPWDRFHPLSFLCVFRPIRVDEIPGLHRYLFEAAMGSCHPFVSGLRLGLLSWPLIGGEVLPGA